MTTILDPDRCISRTVGTPADHPMVINDRALEAFWVKYLAVVEGIDHSTMKVLELELLVADRLEHWEF